MAGTTDERVNLKIRVAPSLKNSLAAIARENERPMVREIAYALKKHVASQSQPA